MSTTYTYTRNYSNGKYDIETTVETVGESVDIYPAKGISDLFPTAKFILLGEDTKFLCVFEKALTPTEKTSLDNYIASYRT